MISKKILFEKNDKVFLQCLAHGAGSRGRKVVGGRKVSYLSWMKGNHTFLNAVHRYEVCTLVILMLYFIDLGTVRS